MDSPSDRLWRKSGTCVMVAPALVPWDFITTPSPTASSWVLALSPSGSSRTTQTDAVPSPTPSHGIRQRKSLSLLIVSGERAAPFPSIPRCSLCSDYLGSGGPSELGDRTFRSVWKSPSPSPCCPCTVINSTPFHSPQYSSLDDRAWGHPVTKLGEQRADPPMSTLVLAREEFLEQNQVWYQRRMWKPGSKSQGCPL